MFRSHQPPSPAPVVLCLLAGVGCHEAPINTNTLRVPPPLNAIEGEIVFGGDDADVIGTTIVTVYETRNPPPPAGGGAPIALSTVPTAAFSDVDAGLRAASFGVGNLADGEYFVNALMDIDGDFYPSSDFPILGGATCGDWLGTHLASIDLANPIPAPVPLAGGELREGGTVVVGSQLPTERPVFAFVPNPEQGDNPIVSLAAVEAAGFGAFRIRTSEVQTDFRLGPPDEDEEEEFFIPLDLGPACDAAGPCDPATQPWCACNPAQFVPESPDFTPCATGILLELVDRNPKPDGLVDVLDPLTGELDIWPRVFVEYAGWDPRENPQPTFEFEGRTLRERWIAKAFPLAAELQAVQAKLLPPEILPPVGTTIPVSELSITIPPVFRHYHADGATIDPTDANGPYDDIVLGGEAGGSADAVPKGRWSVTLVSVTGQTWTVPNTIGALQLDLDQFVGVQITP